MAEHEKVNPSQAQSEINAWLDSKRIRDSRREQRESQIQDLTSAIQEGLLIYNDEDHTLTHKLIFPIGEIDQVVYKNRIHSLEVERYLKGVAANDADGRLRAWVCALTNQPVNVIRKMDTEDLSIAINIALFFQ